jgi:hypothetical protein
MAATRSCLIALHRRNDEQSPRGMTGAPDQSRGICSDLHVVPKPGDGLE